MLVHIKNPHDILMLNLSISKDMQRQIPSEHGHFLAMKNTAYHTIVDNKVNAIYIVYKIRNYDGTGI